MSNRLLFGRWLKLRADRWEIKILEMVDTSLLIDGKAIVPPAIGH